MKVEIIGDNLVITLPLEASCQSQGFNLEKMPDKQLLKAARKLWLKKNREGR